MASLKQLTLLIIFVLSTVTNLYGLENALKISPQLIKQDVVHRNLFATDQLENADSTLSRDIKPHPSKILRNGKTPDTNSQFNQYYLISNSCLIACLLNLKKHNSYYVLTNSKFKSKSTLARAPPKIS
jgi:hypothetical protein